MWCLSVTADASVSRAMASEESLQESRLFVSARLQLPFSTFLGQGHARECSTNLPLKHIRLPIRWSELQLQRGGRWQDALDRCY